MKNTVTENIAVLTAALAVAKKAKTAARAWLDQADITIRAAEDAYCSANPEPKFPGPLGGRYEEFNAWYRSAEVVKWRDGERAALDAARVAAGWRGLLDLSRERDAQWSKIAAELRVVKAEARADYNRANGIEYGGDVVLVAYYGGRKILVRDEVVRGRYVAAEIVPSLDKTTYGAIRAIGPTGDCKPTRPDGVVVLLTELPATGPWK